MFASQEATIVNKNGDYPGNSVADKLTASL